MAQTFKPNFTQGSINNDQNLDQYQKSQSIKMPLTDYYLNKYGGGETQNKPADTDPYLQKAEG